MKYKSQNSETKIVLDYFKGTKGTVLEIGANNGTDLSNSYDLVKLGWKAVLVEPSSVYHDLEELHKFNSKVETHNVAIGLENGTMTFYESAAHVKGGEDRALVSTLVKQETERWKGVDFTEKEVPVITFNELLRRSKHKKFDYISIDVEGMEYEILSQIDLKETGTKVLCIEWNGDEAKAKQFKEYCRNFRLKEIHSNAENKIYSI